MRIFFDVDTQHDFMDKDGALYVPGAEEIKSNLYWLTDYARNNLIPVLCSLDIHYGTPEFKERERELQRWGGLFPDHCLMSMNGFSKNPRGFDKIPQTILDYDSRCAFDNAIIFVNHLIRKISRDEAEKEILEMIKSNPYTNYSAEQITSFIEGLYKRANSGIDEARLKLVLPEFNEKHYPLAVYFEKQYYDVFTNPNLDELLKRVKVDEAVVYGVATDYCVKAAVLGFQKRGVQCYVVKDAIAGVSPNAVKSALEEMLDAGAKLIKTKDLLEARI